MPDENGRVDRLVREFYEFKGRTDTRLSDVEKDISGVGLLIHRKLFLRTAGVSITGGSIVLALWQIFQELWKLWGLG